jgi:hypothetical protein
MKNFELPTCLKLNRFAMAGVYINAVTYETLGRCSDADLYQQLWIRHLFGLIIRLP